MGVINVCLGDNGQFELSDMTQRTVGLFGVKGAGKTYTIAVILEELQAQRVRYVFLDPIGALAKKEKEGERKSPENEAYLKSELRGDNGGAIAEAICNPQLKMVSFQLDLSGMNAEDRVRFVDGLCEALLRINKEDLILIADEVHEVAPARPQKGQAMSKGHFMRICTLGRNKNIGVVIASQRMNKVHADLRELVDVLVFHKLIHALSLDAARDLLKHHVTDKGELEGIISRIQALDVGEIFLFDPSALNPARNGEKPTLKEAVAEQGNVRQVEGDDEKRKEAGLEPAEAKPEAGEQDDDEEEVEVEGKAEDIPAGNLPPQPPSNLLVIDRDLHVGDMVDLRWTAGSFGHYRGRGQIVKLNKSSVGVSLLEEVPVRGSSMPYPIGHRITVPRFGRDKWAPFNGVFPLAMENGKAEPGTPQEVAQAAYRAASQQGLPPQARVMVAKAAAEAHAGHYEREATTSKGAQLAASAPKPDGKDVKFVQKVIASEPAGAQTHSTKHGVPGDEVYADDDFSPEQLHPLAVHEWTEEHAIRAGLSQPEAHQVANAAERAAAGDPTFEAGLVEAKLVADKARAEVGITAHGKARKPAPRIHVITDTPPATCDLCGVKAELRPYGPNGEHICFKCGMKDKASTEAGMKRAMGGKADPWDDDLDQLAKDGYAYRTSPTPLAGKAYHKVFTQLDPEVVARVKAYMESHPWQGTPEQQLMKATSLIRDLEMHYDLPQTDIRFAGPEVGAGAFAQAHGSPTILLRKMSVVTLLHEFRHSMQRNIPSLVIATGAKLGPDPSPRYDDPAKNAREEDARAWSLSVYAAAAPDHFTRGVRRRVIMYVEPEDIGATAEITNYAELVEAFPPGDGAWHIEHTDRPGRYLILAPHGGGIEPLSDQLAKDIAGQDHAHYSFIADLPEDQADAVHMTSHLFDEPIALDLASKHATIIAPHGKKGTEEQVEVGGADAETADRITDALVQAGFDAHPSDGGFSGARRDNICNRGTSGMGVQLELTRGLRDHLRTDAALYRKFVDAVRSALTSGGGGGNSPPIDPSTAIRGVTRRGPPRRGMGYRPHGKAGLGEAQERSNKQRPKTDSTKGKALSLADLRRQSQRSTRTDTNLEA